MSKSTAPDFDDAFRAKLETLFRWRRDVRRFKPDPIESGLLDDLLALAALAPSVGLSQPWRFVIVDDPVRRAAVRRNFEAANADALAAYRDERKALYAKLKLAGFDQAPCHLALFADPQPEQGHGLGRRTMPETVAYSAVMAAHTLWLAARAYGIGVGWVSILDPSAIAGTLDINSSWLFVGYFCLGYPQEEDDLPDLERRGWERRREGAATALLRR
jgi:5,6-dimethylbenzimidazole synthase